MNLYKLKHNEEKTENFYQPPKIHQGFVFAFVSRSQRLLNHLSPSVCNLGTELDKSLSFRQYVADVCRLCYLEIRCMSSVHHLITVDAIKTLLCAFVLLRLDHCNALLAGSPKYLIGKLQNVQNHAAQTCLLLFQIWLCRPSPSVSALVSCP